MAPQLQTTKLLSKYENLLNIYSSQHVSFAKMGFAGHNAIIIALDGKTDIETDIVSADRVLLRLDTL